MILNPVSLIIIPFFNLFDNLKSNKQQFIKIISVNLNTNNKTYII